MIGYTKTKENLKKRKLKKEKAQNIDVTEFMERNGTDLTNFIEIFENLAIERPKQNDVFFEKNGAKVYINDVVSYITVEIGSEKWAFSYNVLYHSWKLTEGFLDDRIEMLLIDALETTYKTIFEKNYKSQIKQKKLIDKLFKEFVERRSLKAPDEIIMRRPNNIYI